MSRASGVGLMTDIAEGVQAMSIADAAEETVVAGIDHDEVAVRVFHAAAAENEDVAIDTDGSEFC